MDIGEKLVVHSRGEWRDWLARNHIQRADIWLVFFKKGTGKRTVEYGESVEEALCYGWIDGQMKSIDGESYAIRFSPRRRRSRWSETNRAAALRLVREGRMTEAGLAVMPPEL